MAADHTTNGNGHKSKFEQQASGGFRVRGSMVRPDLRHPPRVASARGYMRNALPGIYQNQDFGMRFVGGFEETLDPILAMLDSMHAHLNPQLAPPDFLQLMASWFGVVLNEAQPIQQHRLRVSNASELWRSRGTVRGLKLALDLSFPELTFRVQDSGSAVWSREERELPAAKSQFDVFCDEPVSKATNNAIARQIEQFKPAHMSFILHSTVEEQETTVG